MAYARYIVVVLLIFLSTNISANSNTENLKYLAQKYYWGKTVQRNYVKALDLYLKAAELGDKEAQYIAGGMYYKGYGTPVDYIKAFSHLYGAAISGRSTSQSQKILGEFFLTGTSVPRNYAEAMKWYKMSAENGDRDSQSELAFLYFTGRGGERDPKKAFYWFEKSARQGLAIAQYSLGIMYFSGNGIDEADLIMAYAWLSLSAAQGNVDANVARDYLETVLSQDELQHAQSVSIELFREIVN